MKINLKSGESGFSKGFNLTQEELEETLNKR